MLYAKLELPKHDGDKDYIFIDPRNIDHIGHTMGNPYNTVAVVLDDGKVQRALSVQFEEVTSKEEYERLRS